MLHCNKKANCQWDINAKTKTSAGKSKTDVRGEDFPGYAEDTAEDSRQAGEEDRLAH